MAEIKIEKKTPVWPWILLVLVVIGIVIYMVAFNDDGEDTPERAAETTDVQTDTRQDAPANSTVQAYVSFIQDDPDQMGLDHEFTNEALKKLTDATEAKAADIDYDIRKDIEAVRTHAEKITRDPFATTHANSIRDAAGILAGALKQMQVNSFPDLAADADNVKNAATDIEVDVLTLDQKEKVKHFFRESADLLEKMNNNEPEI